MEGKINKSNIKPSYLEAEKEGGKNHVKINNMFLPRERKVRQQQVQGQLLRKTYQGHCGNTLLSHP